MVGTLTSECRVRLCESRSRRLSFRAAARNLACVGLSRTGGRSLTAVRDDRLRGWLPFRVIRQFGGDIPLNPSNSTRWHDGSPLLLCHSERSEESVSLVGKPGTSERMFRSAQHGSGKARDAAALGWTGPGEISRVSARYASRRERLSFRTTRHADADIPLRMTEGDCRTGGLSEYAHVSPHTHAPHHGKVQLWP